VDQRTFESPHHLNRCLAGNNPLSPDLMTADERLEELGQILGTALVRLRQRRFLSECSSLQKNSVDFSPHRSGYASAPQRREIRR
jgi:hypothetical protein